MKRVGVVLAVVGLVLFISPSPASAAPCDGLLCIGGEDGLLQAPLVERLVDTLAGTVDRAIDPPPAPSPTPAPQPVPSPAPVRPQAPAPSSPRPSAPGPQTNATPEPTRSIPAPTTSTAPERTATRTNAPTGQEGQRSGTVEASTPTQTTPVNPGVDSPVVPDDPEVAAFTGSLFGLAIGLVCAFLLMFIAYRRGQAAGEEKSINDFLGYIRGTNPPEPGRHRST